MSMYASTNQKPRSSGIPTPGRPSTGIPTPGRLRSVSSAGSNIQSPSAALTPVDDTTYMSRTLADAIKANDPAQHRTTTSGHNLTTLSPSSSSHGYSNGKSTSNRPSSVASSVSAVSSVNSRVSTSQSHPIPARSASRQSNVHGRSVSRTGGRFETGDDVRIESLGFEGVLRFVGPIEGKPGEWAGVELGGGFIGKGKNDGSVNGIKYFVCPPKCGVFVAVDKLSAPAVRTSISSRPSSVASIRSTSGRVTPSYSGRITPSTSNGRVTPSLPSGRITPSLSTSRVGLPTPTGRTTPANRRTTTGPFTTPKTVTKPPVPTSQITPGSRASKYVGVTATQLRKSPAIPRKLPTGRESPTRSATHSIASPVRSIGTGSPFNTPKVLGSRYDDATITGSPTSKGKLSLKTPRPRLPSSVAMPPPSSPSSKMGPGDDEGGLPSSASLQSLHAARMQRTLSASSVGPSSPRPGSAASSTANDWVRQQELLTEDIARLQSRLDALEYENEELRQKADAAEALAATSSQSRATSSVDSYTTANSPMIDTIPAADTSALNEKIEHLSGERDSLTKERDELSTRVSALETGAKAQERALAERESKIESLERAVKESTLDLTQLKTDSENRQKELQSKLEDNEEMLKNLKEVLTAKEGQETESGAILVAKDKEITLLESRMEKMSKEWEEERTELQIQVQELRLAGQETIGLYEERLGNSETKRYELEDQVASLEEQLRAAARPSSPTSLAKYASSAAQIENETLQDQVTHLQNKIRTLEDMLEDARAAAEKDELVVRERIKRYKDKEESMKKEAVAAKKEMERLIRAEEQARQRLGEIEEAFRENHLTLENARAEIETLRGELVDTEDARVDRTASREVTTSNEKWKLEEEITGLKEKLAESSKRQTELEQQSEGGHQDTVAALRQELEERSAEIDALKKKANRETTVTVESARPAPQSPSSKHDLNSARDEIKGLKHIIQELQKENQAAKQQTKLMESENQLLMNETEQLRQEMKVLEEDVEKSLQREESKLDAEEEGYPDDVQKVVQELKSKHNLEVEQLRKRVNEMEMKNARVVHGLHKEMSELEALVESKIYREDDLEREIERLKEKLAKSQKKSSKNANGLPSDPVAGDPPSSAAEVCEICERPGHDIFTCDLLKDDSSSAPHNSGKTSTRGELYCEDCEETGHVAADCPHSLDVF